MEGWPVQDKGRPEARFYHKIPMVASGGTCRLTMTQPRSIVPAVQ